MYQRWRKCDKGLSCGGACGDDVGRSRRRSGYRAAARRRPGDTAWVAGSAGTSAGTAAEMQHGVRERGIVLVEIGLRRAGGHGARSGGARLRERVRVGIWFERGCGYK